MIKTIEIALNVRRKWYQDGVRASGDCYMISKRIRAELRENGIEANLIEGTFTCSDGEKIGHCWLELDNNTILDATANQFFEIPEDILIGTYDEYPQYKPERLS